MELEKPNNGDEKSLPDLQNPNNGDSFDPHQIPPYTDEIDSTCSTPYVSAPSSPGRCSNSPYIENNSNGYFFSAPASPMHFILSSNSSSSNFNTSSSSSGPSVSGSFEFEFSARFSANNTTRSMSSADELFFNGQIRPMKLSSHLQRPQILSPLADGDEEDDESRQDLVRGRDLRLRNRSLHRRARSLSPLRNNIPFQVDVDDNHETEEEEGCVETPSTETTPSVSASSSRSSSTGSRNSKRWVFLKDFLRSKSEGRGNSKEKFWSSISFSPAKEKKQISGSTCSATSTSESQKQKMKLTTMKKTNAVKPANGVSKRRVPQSAHELHYTTNRAQAEEMKKRTFLPYKQGLLGCLGFSSKSYGAFNGFTRALNPVSSRISRGCTLSLKNYSQGATISHHR